MQTTIGQLVLNRLLPPGLQNPGVLDKKGLEKLLQAVAEKHPEDYRRISHDLAQVGAKTSYWTGGNSFGLRHLRASLAARRHHEQLARETEAIHAHPTDTDDEKDLKVVEAIQSHMKPMEDDVFKESLAEGNPLAMQVLSGARGNASNLKSLRGGDLLYVDHKDRPIPIPITRSYSQGLTPAQYFSGSFGARKGTMDTKFSTRDSGFLSKQMVQVSHRLRVTAHDHDEDQNRLSGMPVEAGDPDNEGALLAQAAGGYKRNTVLTPKIISELASRGLGRILIRSPIAGGAEDGGLLARDVGVREHGGLPAMGSFVGVAAAHALSEPIAQGALSSKHSGGVAGAAKTVTGFPRVNQLVQVPKVFKGGAAHAQRDGRVQSVCPAPQGGSYITIDGEQHYVAQGFAPLVKPGDEVEAGDVLSEGLPNPAEVVKHKGVGEGRRYFVEAMRSAYKDSGIFGHRRNMELLARGLVDHVRMTEEHGRHIPGDVVPYSRLEHSYEPRDGVQLLEAKRAKGMYLERPALHYSIGTKIKPSVIKTLEEFKAPNVLVHKDPPPFEPEMVRGLESVSHDPDWLTRFLGSYLSKSLLRGAHRGDVSDEKGTSYVPSLARAVDFGKVGPGSKLSIPSLSP